MLKELGVLSGFKALALFLYLGLHLLSRSCRVHIGTLKEKGKVSIMVSYIGLYLHQLKTI